MLTSIKLNDATFSTWPDQGVVLIGAEADFLSLPIQDEELKSLKKNIGGDKRSFLLTLGESQTFFVRPKSHSSREYQLDHGRKAGAEVWEQVKDWKKPKTSFYGKDEDLFLAFIEGLMLASYSFIKYKSKKKKRPGQLEVCHAGLSLSAIEEVQLLVNATFEARDLVNEPVSFLDTLQLGKEIVRLGEKYGFETEIHDKAKIASLKMAGLLAVNAGSKIPPLFAVLKHRPKETRITAPLILVGKGVVYDTGGLSLKPTANSMDFMKSDMAGAAAVIGAFCALSQLDLPMEIIGLIPITDNRPGYNAMVPGDVLTFANGKTVEILNTDAEGRLILADALIYARKYKPQLVIDLATLTGSAAAAIGKEGAVMMGTAPVEKKEMLESSGLSTFERLVEFPLWEEYDEQIRSEIADIANLGGSTAGAITAGKFLEHFIDYDWIHIDIAGPSYQKKGEGYKPAGGSGFGVRLLYRFLKQLRTNEQKN
jgi:leucyl aminopeptidase